MKSKTILYILLGLALLIALSLLAVDNNLGGWFSTPTPTQTMTFTPTITPTATSTSTATTTLTMTPTHTFTSTFTNTATQTYTTTATKTPVPYIPPTDTQAPNSDGGGEQDCNPWHRTRL
jgi:hypothetical protein